MRAATTPVGLSVLVDKANKPQFGIDPAFVADFDWDLATARILHDTRTDFIFAPHIARVFRRANETLQEEVATELRNGEFAPGLPITIEVPKSARMRVRSSRRQGPSFSRPGSILLPKDRLLYQLLADVAAPILEAATDRARSFSHRLAEPDSEEMFLPSRDCWNDMHAALTEHAAGESNRYALKIDVANCFASINLHTLINFMSHIGYPRELCGPLENVLVRFTTSRSSRGIVQGMFPSDLLGNFYLTPADQVLDDMNVPSVRYVDDIYIFLPDLSTAEHVLRRMTAELRTYDLWLNEAKSYVLPSAAIVTEEPDLEDLFAEAVNEVRGQVDPGSDVGYGFQSAWDEEEDDVEDLELRATESLFANIPQFRGSEEKIERFCLPLFARAGSDFAVDYVLENFMVRPSMAQIYCSYLNQFVNHSGEVKDFLQQAILDDAMYFDWQTMWVLATILRCDAVPDGIVRRGLDIVRGSSGHDSLRAVAAILVGKFGGYARRRSLIAEYPNIGAPYVQGALLYSARYFSSVERRNAVTNWAGHGYLHRLIADSITAGRTRPG